MNAYVTNKYPRVDITLDGKRQSVFVHKLVMQAFAGMPKDFTMQIHHRDCNKLNSDLRNLQYVTPAEHKKIHMKLEQQKKQKEQLSKTDGCSLDNQEE